MVHYFRVPKTFKRGYQDFPSKVFCLTVPKKFVGEPFGVSLISVIENDWIRGEGDYQLFPSKIFCLSVEKFCRGTLSCFINFGNRKSL